MTIPSPSVPADLVDRLLISMLLAISTRDLKNPEEHIDTILDALLSEISEPSAEHMDAMGVEKSVSDALLQQCSDRVEFFRRSSKNLLGAIRG